MFAIWDIINGILTIYLLFGLISLCINLKYFLMILQDKKFRKLIWKIILLIETILLWPLTIKLSYKIIRNFMLKLFLKSRFENDNDKRRV